MRITDYIDIWVVAFEATNAIGETPKPAAYWAKELRSGQIINLNGRRLWRTRRCPIPCRDDVLVVAYDGVPSLHCFHDLSWPIPKNLIDLHVESRLITNGIVHPDNLSIALMLSAGGGMQSDSNGMPGLGYLADLEKLFQWYERRVPDLERALYRATFLSAAAEIERVGIPVDVALHRRLQVGLSEVLRDIVEEVDRDYGIYRNGKLDPELFRRYLIWEGLPMPVDGHGQILTDFDTIKSLSRSFPSLKRIKQLEWLLNQMKLHRLAVGPDGRNRTPIRPYRSRSGRNQPRSAESIMGWSGFMRRLIRPEAGRALAYIDFRSEEIGIAAALSQDANLIAAYESGDVYSAFAAQCGITPEAAEKITWADIRERYKVALLGIGYGMGAPTLARRLEIPLPNAREILAKHRTIYRGYWEWSESAVDFAAYHAILTTRQGWSLHISPEMSTEAIRNFPLQAHGAEIIRLASAIAQHRDITVCMPVHDALLIEADTGDIERAARECQRAMGDASEIILGGFRLRTEVKTICRHPDSYAPDTGAEMWARIMRMIGGRAS